MLSAMPSERRLDALDLARSQGHLRLIDQVELVALDPGGQVEDREPRLLALQLIQGRGEVRDADRLAERAHHVQPALDRDPARRFHHRAVGAADQDDAGLGLLRRQMRQQGEAVHHRHLQVHHDVRRPPVAHMLQELVRGGDGEDLVAHIGCDPSDQGADRRFVIHDQETIGRHCPTSVNATPSPLDPEPRKC